MTFGFALSWMPGTAVVASKAIFQIAHELQHADNSIHKGDMLASVLTVTDVVSMQPQELASFSPAGDRVSSYSWRGTGQGGPSLPSGSTGNMRVTSSPPGASHWDQASAHFCLMLGSIAQKKLRLANHECED